MEEEISEEKLNILLEELENILQEEIEEYNRLEKDDLVQYLYETNNKLP